MHVHHLLNKVVRQHILSLQLSLKQDKVYQNTIILSNFLDVEFPLHRFKVEHQNNSLISMVHYSKILNFTIEKVLSAFAIHKGMSSASFLNICIVYYCPKILNDQSAWR